MGPLQNLHMFVGCFEISIRAIAINNKHVTRGLVTIFSAWGGGGGRKNGLGGGWGGGGEVATEEYAGLWFARGGSVPTQADTMTFQQRI